MITDFDVIQLHANNFVTPPDIGRIPFKIFSRFSAFTADHAVEEKYTLLGHFKASNSLPVLVPICAGMQLTML